MLAPDYDATDSSPANLRELEAYQDRADGPIWSTKEVTCTLAPSRMQDTVQNSYIRTDNDASSDLRLEDCANFFVGLVTTATGLLGRLYVRYTCRFFTPQLQADENVPVNESFFSQSIPGWSGLNALPPAVSREDDALRCNLVEGTAGDFQLEGLVPGQTYTVTSSVDNPLVNPYVVEGATVLEETKDGDTVTWLIEAITTVLSFVYTSSPTGSYTNFLLKLAQMYLTPETLLTMHARRTARIELAAQNEEKS